MSDPTPAAMVHARELIAMIATDLAKSPKPPIDPEAWELAAALRFDEFYRAKVNTPLTNDFLPAVANEAQHQRDRWGEKHDDDKSDADWFWLIGYVAGKAFHDIRGKRHHHIITTAAVLLNWLETEHRRETRADVACELEDDRIASTPDGLIWTCGEADCTIEIRYPDDYALGLSILEHQATAHPKPEPQPMRLDIDLDWATRTCPCGVSLCSRHASDGDWAAFLAEHFDHSDGFEIQHHTADGARILAERPADVVVELKRPETPTS